jgi:hypothetical protein
MPFRSPVCPQELTRGEWLVMNIDLKHVSIVWERKYVDGKGLWYRNQ